MHTYVHMSNLHLLRYAGMNNCTTILLWAMLIIKKNYCWTTATAHGQEGEEPDIYIEERSITLHTYIHTYIYLPNCG